MRPVTLAPGFLRADLDALLAARPFQTPIAEAITIRLKSQQWAGIDLFYTSAQQDFTAPACDGTGTTTYIAGDVGVDGLKLKLSSGQSGGGNDPTTSIAVDEQTLTLTPNLGPTPSLIDGVPLLAAIRSRALTGAIIQRDRWFFDADYNPVGGAKMFYGYASSIDKLSRTQASLKVKAATVLLNIQMPRNLYQPNCVYTVYSGDSTHGCGAVKSSFVQHGVVGSSPSRSVIPWSGGVPGSIPFANGEVFFETGPAINQTRTIRAYDGTNLYLQYPLTVPPLAGDQFAAYPGCNRADPLAAGSTSDCIFFSRQGAYRAAPRTPQNELGV
ncbi:MAG TPA: phage BR0599 family protein [Caulobacteraceae bacterium]